MSDHVAVAGCTVATVVADVRVVLTGPKGVTGFSGRTAIVFPFSFWLSHVSPPSPKPHLD